MKTITSLSGDVAEVAPFKAPPLAVLHDNSQQGFFRRVSLSSDGLTISRRDVAIQISLAALLDLAEKNEPALAPHPNGKPILQLAHSDI